MNKSSTLILVVATVLLLSTHGSSALRVRTNPNRARYSTASPITAAVEESSEHASQINVEELEQKFSFPDPAAQNFKTKLESDRKSFGVNSPSFSELSNNFGKGLRKRKPSYQISEEVDDDNGGDTGSYEVNFKNTVTHKPGPSFDTSSFKFGSSVNAPKTKFGSSTKFSSFGSGSSQPGLFKLNEPSSSLSSSSLGSGGITTKFAINHPAPTHSASNLGGSYQTYSEESSGPTSGQLTEKFISDYHTALSKLKTEKPKFQNSSPYKTKFSDGSNFKVSSDFKVGAETQFHKSHKLSSTDFPEFKPNFRLQEVPNLYPSDDQFRPSVGYPGANQHNSGNKLFEPNSDNEEFVQQQLAKNPASKGQYQQFLKSQEDEKIEQQALLEQLKYQQTKPKGLPPKGFGFGRPSASSPQGYTGSSTKFRPFIQVKKNFNRRKPLVRVASSPGLSHYRTPAIDGPYTIHFSV